MEDGLEVLKAEFSVKEVARLIERTARWVAPETFQHLPVWYPEYARRDLLYKKNWTEPQYNTNRNTGERVHKQEGNGKANIALGAALGLSPKDRPNWSCCHIWGVDDPSFQKSNTIVVDKRYFSCVANMVLLPTPLKAFTDSMPEIKTMLRVCAAYLFNWSVDSEDIADLQTEESFCDWASYPSSWPKPGHQSLPVGVVPFDERIRKRANKRLSSIVAGFDTAGEFYPREEIRRVLDYWKINNI